MTTEVKPPKLERLPFRDTGLPGNDGGLSVSAGGCVPWLPAGAGITGQAADGGEHWRAPPLFYAVDAAIQGAYHQ